MGGEQPMFVYSKRDQDDFAWLMPDFGYWSWPEVKVGTYKEIRQRIAAIDDGFGADGVQSKAMDFNSKIKKLVWRGAVQTAPEIRGKFVEATNGQPWADVKTLDWGSEEDIKANLIPMEDHCKFMFVAHTEGQSWSGRGKYLQNCRSVFVAHELEWREAHHGALQSSGPGQNFVQVNRNFSDLPGKIEYLVAHTLEARKIADNSVKDFRDRYLTPAAEACYWRRLIRGYASVNSFTPKFYSDAEGKQWRGVPFESFVLTRTLTWEAH
jgi:Glycosyl transferase family 90